MSPFLVWCLIAFFYLDHTIEQTMGEQMTTDHEHGQGNDIARYLSSQEHYQIVLLDMLRSNEISQEEYDKAMKMPKDASLHPKKPGDIN